MTDPAAEFGYTPWGRDYLRLAEPLRVTRPEPLLPRARTLARTAITDVQIDGRAIRGTVVRGGQASVATLEFRPMRRETAQAVAAAVGAAPTSSRLTADVHAMTGDDPVELAAIDCSCRARTPRCVHALALMYRTVRHVDEDPRLALSLRGFQDALGDRHAGESGIVQWTPLTALDPADFAR